jgi:uncharacterized protein
LLTIGVYSGTRVDVPRNRNVEWHFPQENATFHKVNRCTVTLEPLWKARATIVQLDRKSSPQATNIGEKIMMRIPMNAPRQFVIAAFLVGSILAAPVSGFGDSITDPDVPSVKLAPQPRSVADQIKLANDYFAGRGVAQDLKLSAYWFMQAAESGDPQAEMQIGYFYNAGIGVTKDAKLAAHWYQLAAAAGLATAKVNLGVLYLWGSGVPQNVQLASQLLREAAAKGSGLADAYLGDLYFLGAGVPQDKAQGERWYAKGAAQHNPMAEFDLGMLFFVQADHPHDPRKAAELFRESSDAGYVPAMASLGLLLVRNPSLAQSPDEAIKQLNDSAEAGIWKSSIILGALARDGNLLPPDPGEAYFHFRVAALQGGDPAKSLVAKDLQALTARLEPSQTAALDARAEEWRSQHHLVLEFVNREHEGRSQFPNYALAAPEVGTHAVQMVPSQTD